MTDVGGVDPDGVGVVQTGRFLADFDLEYRANMIQADFSEIFACCARRQILKQNWRHPGKGQAAAPPSARRIVRKCVRKFT